MLQGKLNVCFSAFCRRFPVTVVLFTFAVLPGVLQAADYPSLYLYGQTGSYCSASPCGGTSGCEKYYRCSSDLPYQYTRKLVGFRNLYNLNDPKILCRQDLSGIDGCAPEEKSLNLRLATSTNSNYDYISQFPDTFRIFIPAGTVRCGIVIKMPIGVEEGLVARYGQPPEAASFSSFGAVPWDSSDTSANLETMAVRNVYLKNAGGTATILSTFARQIPMSAAESGWLYLRKMPFTGSMLDLIMIDLKVDVDAYRDWYNGVMWDENGDPTAEAACVDAGTCDGKLDCLGSGFHWYDDDCHAEPKCREDNLEGCEEAECIGLVDEKGNRLAYWYDDNCYDVQACDVADGCGEGYCEDGSGFYWYEDEFGDAVCNSGLACSLDSLNSCNTKLKCESAGFYWDGDECLSSSGTTNYSSSSSSTTTYSNSSSYSSYSFSSSSNSSSSTNSNSGSLGIAALFGLSSAAGQQTETKVCDQENLELCNQGECEVLGSGYWHDGARCREDGDHEYNGSPVEAPVCLGNGGDDGSLNVGESFILKANLAAEIICYAIIMLPNNDYFFIGGNNQQLPFTRQMVPVRQEGILYQLDNLCANLPEDYQGEWKIYFLTIPAANGEFTDVGSLGDYLERENARYVIGSTTIVVDCGRTTNNIAAAFGSFIQ